MVFCTTLTPCTCCLCLQARPNSIAVFVPSEITTYCFYPGLQKDYMVANAIFRMGGAAVMCTNKAKYWRTAKYQLMHNVRVHTGSDDGAYSCMGWGPDKDGINGVYLRKDVPLQAAKALEACLRTIAPKILTWSQYAEAAYNLFEKTVLGGLWQNMCQISPTASTILHCMQVRIALLMPALNNLL